ncbi:hypothetical protein [Sagittula sp.]|uniref:hypothetical protein n=1 Tax=Sagittula sp. TaxID=2038081 RepID=UPI003511E64E
MFTTFLTDETGAVTIDWIVLTAAMVGLCLLATTIMDSTTLELSEGIGQFMQDTAPDGK